MSPVCELKSKSSGAEVAAANMDVDPALSENAVTGVFNLVQGEGVCSRMGSMMMKDGPAVPLVHTSLAPRADTVASQPKRPHIGLCRRELLHCEPAANGKRDAAHPPGRVVRDYISGVCARP